MRKYILYLFILALGVVLYFVTKGQRSEIMVFYGFSENKEKELNFDYDVKVVEILVNSGQYVNQGDPLIKVERTSNPLRLSDIENRIELMELRKQAKTVAVQNDIKAIKNNELIDLIEIDNEIDARVNNINRNKLLLEVIDDMEFQADSMLKGTDQLKIEELEKQKNYIRKTSNLAIATKNNDLNAWHAEYEVEMAKLENELKFYDDQEKNHVLKAPTDAIVGFINCNTGENYSSFSKLLSLYDPHPQLVKGYILESMITSIEIDDSVIVSSALSPGKSYKGIVTGFGTRITEIPNRLSKIPELTMYGREVLITLPQDNDLLQKEKVKVQLLSTSEETSLSKKITNFE